MPFVGRFPFKDLLPFDGRLALLATDEIKKRVMAQRFTVSLVLDARLLAVMLTGCT